MPDYPGLDGVLAEWAHLVPPPPQPAAPRTPDDYGLGEEAPDLARLLATPRLSLPDVAKQPVGIFGGLGGGLIFMTNEEFVWLLPVAALFAILSEDFDSLLVGEMEKRLPQEPSWLSLKERVSLDSWQWLYSLVKQCCRQGWTKERAIKKHLAACRDLFV